MKEMKDLDAVVIAVAHNEFKTLKPEDIDKLYKASSKNDNRVLIDVKGLLDRKEYEKLGYNYFRL